MPCVLNRQRVRRALINIERKALWRPSACVRACVRVCVRVRVRVCHARLVHCELQSGLQLVGESVVLFDGHVKLPPQARVMLDRRRQNPR